MKKILCILIAAMLVMGFIACAPSAEQVEKIESDPLIVEMIKNIVAIATRAILLLILCFLAKIGLPLLEKFGLMWIVRIFVKAAEKQGETGAIDKAQKKQHVLHLLQLFGISKTPLIENMIEAAVAEIDAATPLYFDTINNYMNSTEAADPPAVTTPAILINPDQQTE